MRGDIKLIFIFKDAPPRGVRQRARLSIILIFILYMRLRSRNAARSILAPVYAKATPGFAYFP